MSMPCWNSISMFRNAAGTVPPKRHKLGRAGRKIEAAKRPRRQRFRFPAYSGSVSAPAPPAILVGRPPPKLLRDIEARYSLLDHAVDATHVTSSAIQPLGGSRRLVHKLQTLRVPFPMRWHSMTRRKRQGPSPVCRSPFRHGGARRVHRRPGRMSRGPTASSSVRSTRCGD